jgi:hypothetical protein
MFDAAPTTTQLLNGKEKFVLANTVSDAVSMFVKLN